MTPLLRNPKQIPYPEPPSPIQNPTNAEKERETASIRELVEVIDSHVELVDLEITSNPDALPRSSPASTSNPTMQITQDTAAKHAVDTTNDPT